MPKPAATKKVRPNPRGSEPKDSPFKRSRSFPKINMATVPEAPQSIFLVPKKRPRISSGIKSDIHESQAT